MLAQEPNGLPEGSSASRKTPRKRVAEARALAQRAKLDKEQQEHTPQKDQRSAKGKNTQQDLQAKRRASTTIARAIDDYLQDHEGGNHSAKTIEWHQIALGLMRTYLERERAITLVGEIDASDISSWFASMRKTPGKHGKPRTERTIQTYARSARAFFHWLVRRGTLEHNPFDKVTFPKVGKPLIQTISSEEFERLLLACTPPNEAGPIAERAAVRNRAIFWLLYDTGIRVSELCNLRLDQFDRRHAIITVKGKGSKERRIALGNNCLRNVLYYLDKHRPDEEELAEWGSSGEDHLFLAETRTPLTKNGVEMLFKRVRERAGITDRRLSPHILRHTFAINYLISGGDPFSLQELLGHENMDVFNKKKPDSCLTKKVASREEEPGVTYSKKVADSEKSFQEKRAIVVSEEVSRQAHQASQESLRRVGEAVRSLMPATRNKRCRQARPLTWWVDSA